MRRPPRGGRGLKFQGDAPTSTEPLVSPPSRGAWIEISITTPKTGRKTSPPSRGAWIEMMLDTLQKIHDLHVAPLAGGVD